MRSDVCSDQSLLACRKDWLLSLTVKVFILDQLFPLASAVKSGSLKSALTFMENL